MTSISIEENKEQSLDVFKAVREILQNVQCKNQKSSLHASIKSTKKCQNTVQNTWFYIKVTTSSEIDKLMLEDELRNPALYSVLRYMQGIENESHLCIKNPCNLEGEGCGSVQQNLILEGQRLIVMQEVTKTTQIRESTLHLRVQQSVGYMMIQCRDVHSYMTQLRIFSPEIDMSFTMNVGEAVSQTNFSIRGITQVIQSLPAMVTDPAFFLQDSGLTAVVPGVSSCAVAPVLISIRGPCTGSTFSIQVSALALYIPVRDSISRSVTLTLYGPGYLPLSMTDTTCKLLEDIEWRKYDMKIDSDSQRGVKGLLSHHTSVVVKSLHSGHIGHFILPVFLMLLSPDCDNLASDYQYVQDALQCLCQDNKLTLVSVIQGTLDKAFQPLLNNIKSRELVMNSIHSVCKAVADVMSMSSNEHFRSIVLQCMKVADTVDLATELNQKLTHLSHNRHHGVWGKSSCMPASHCKVTERGLSLDGNRELQECEGAGGSQPEHMLVHTISELVADGYLPDNHGDMNRANNHGDTTITVDRCNRSRDGSDSDMNIVDSFGSDQDRIDVKLASGELRDFTADHAPLTCAVPRFENINNNSNEGIRIVHNGQNRTPELLHIMEDLGSASPFHQLADNSPTVCMNMTPDIEQITQCMQDVSPFLELAEECKLLLDSPEWIAEDPCATDYCQRRVLECLTAESGVLGSQTHSLDINSNSNQLTQRVPVLVKTCSDPPVSMPCADITETVNQKRETTSTHLDTAVVATTSTHLHTAVVATSTHLDTAVIATSTHLDTALVATSTHLDTAVVATSTHLDTAVVATSTHLDTAVVATSTHLDTAVVATTSMHLHLNTSLALSDYELLNSEDFGRTLEVVSNFIDDKEQLNESESDLCQYVEQVECIKRDNIASSIENNCAHNDRHSILDPGSMNPCCNELAQLPTDVASANTACCNELAQLPTDVVSANTACCNELAQLPTDVASANTACCNELVQLPTDVANANTAWYNELAQLPTDVASANTAGCNELAQLPTDVANANTAWCNELVQLPTDVANANTAWCNELAQLPTDVASANTAWCNELVQLPTDVANANTAWCNELVQLPTDVASANTAWCNELAQLPTDVASANTAWCSELVQLPTDVANANTAWCNELVQLPTDVASANTGSFMEDKHFNGSVSYCKNETRHDTIKHVDDSDDCFNDVLMQLEEWLN